jgi:hypothetical protein
MNRRHMVVLATTALMLGAIGAAPSASAAAPDNPSCWGAATADFAQQEPAALGEHASQPPEVDLGLGRPGRAGIGNVARILGGSHPSDAAALLGFDCS